MNRFMYICKMEEWKLIQEHQSFEISNHGRIRKIKTQKIMKPSLNDKGYLLFRTKHNNITMKSTVHRLVAKYFIENPNDYGCVNHIDSNRQNNFVSNLEWCNKQMNTDHAVNVGRIPRRAVINLDSGMRLRSVYELSKHLGWSLSKTKHVISGRTKNTTCWRYVDPIPPFDSHTDARLTAVSFFFTPVQK